MVASQCDADGDCLAIIHTDIPGASQCDADGSTVGFHPLLGHNQAKNIGKFKESVT